MARWGDIAQWVGPTPNENSDGMQSVDGVVLHIQDGNQAGSIAWCKNPASQVSAHFFAPKIGQPQQLVDTGDRAWAEAGGNSHWLSIENEGWSGQDPTPDQIEACAHILAKAHAIYGVPLVATDDPNSRGLGWHGMGGDAWGGHPDCPGEPFKLARAHIIARAQQLLGIATPTPPPPARQAPPWPGRTFVYEGPDTEQISGADVLEWQARMKWRGWTISVDGRYGPQSASVCREFQADSTNHGWYLAQDSEVGPQTWLASWERPVSTP